jgi:hypothetical protein
MLPAMVRVLAIAALVLSIAAPATAQPDDPAPDDSGGDGDGEAPKPEDAKRWMAAGDTLMKKGDQLAKRNKTAEAQSQYERALLSYQKAHEASGNAQVYYAIAAAEEKLGRTKDALLHYRKVTLEVSGNAKLLELATERLGTLSMAVGLFTAAVDPEGADLAIDGVSVAKSPMAEPIVLDPGSYTLVITADGYVPLEVKLAIEGGSESERTFKLDPVPVVFEKPKEAPRKITPKPPPSRPSSAPVWIGGAVTLTLTAVATTTGLLALSKHNQFEDEMGTDPQTREAARKKGKQFAIATDICMVGAVLGAAFTAYYYFGVYKPRVGKYKKQMEKREVSVAPWIEPTIGGVSIGVTY